jgi:Protein of unknown function (DUF1499)
MRILIRTSKWAIWARRIASFALPLAVLPVFMHREQLIPSAAFHIVEALAAANAIFAFVLSLAAMARLWHTGDRGWGRASAGLLVSLVCLAPFAFITTLVLHYPLVTDVATDAANPPVLVIAPNAAAPASDADADIAAVFPNATTRSYPINAQQAFDIVNGLVADRGWMVEPKSHKPATVFGEGDINALATTLLGWRDEVSIRVSGSPQGATIDMRSASLTAIHDLGSNGQRIEDFLTALDNAVTLLIRDNPAAVEPLEGGDDEPPAPVEGEGDTGG